MNRRDALKSMLVGGGLSMAGCGVTISSTSGSQPGTGQFKLVWSDEFSGANGSPPDSKFWTYDIGGGGWGNQELETYTDRPQTVFVRDGNLVIQALKETYTGTDGITRDYTSRRLKTQELISWTDGRFESRIKLPSGQGIWPAFWMLGTNISQVGWPTCGEIDIMENIGSEPSTVHGTIHGPGPSGAYSVGAPYSLPGGEIFAGDFHVFAVEWDPTAIRFYVDNNLYQSVTPSDLPAGATWVFARPFFLILNVAVGGSWPGSPDSSTVFPQQMLVDYVRVYQRQ
jgi:beta-glucanase (GH16 family)